MVVTAAVIVVAMTITGETAVVIVVAIAGATTITGEIEVGEIEAIAGTAAVMIVVLIVHRNNGERAQSLKWESEFSDSVIHSTVVLEFFN